MRIKRWLFCAVCFMFVMGIARAEEKEAKNIIPDGGFEEVSERVIGADRYVYECIQKGIGFGQDGPIAILPSNFGQFYGSLEALEGAKLIVVEGTPGKEVHSGKRALFFCGNGGFYFNGEDYKAKTGDVFKACYYVKGQGSIRLILGLINTEGNYYQSVTPKPVSVNSDEWILIEHTLDTSDKPDLSKICVRLEPKGEIYIDDVSLVEEEDQ